VIRTHRAIEADSEDAPIRPYNSEICMQKRKTKPDPVRRGHKDASQGVGVSEGAFFILIDGIKKALDLTRLRGVFRGVEPRSYWMSSKKMKKAPSETPTP